MPLNFLKDVVVGCCGQVGAVLGRVSNANRAPVDYTLQKVDGLGKAPPGSGGAASPDFANGFDLAKEDVRRASTGVIVYVQPWIFYSGMADYSTGYMAGLKAAGGVLVRTAHGQLVLPAVARRNEDVENGAALAHVLLDASRKTARRKPNGFSDGGPTVVPEFVKTAGDDYRNSFLWTVWEGHGSVRICAGGQWRVFTGSFDYSYTGCDEDAGMGHRPV